MNSAVWDNRRTYWSAGLSTLIHLAVLFVMAIVPPWVGKGQLDGVAFYPVISSMNQTCLKPPCYHELQSNRPEYRPYFQQLIDPTDNETGGIEDPSVTA